MEQKIYEGVVFINTKGNGYVKTKELDDSIEIPNQHLLTSLHGDKVRAIVNGKNEYGNPIGEIVEIISRSKVGFSGTLAKDELGFYLIPSDPKIHIQMRIPNDALLGALLGDKVFTTITRWTDQQSLPVGEVLRVLGKPLENNAEMMGIALEKGFDENFPKAVLEEAEKLKEEGISGDELKIRKDIRGITTFTIDPADAKDFDDALSVQFLPNGNIEVGVHIADVSHYVRPDTELDKEAARRATSVYLVDRTIPMLPEVLSNELCSLNPKEDKLTFSAIFELDEKANVLHEWFGRTIMHSDHRFTYENAQEVLNEEQGIYFKELSTLNTLAKKLEKKRMEAGALSLDQDEVKFLLDQHGVPIKVYKKERGDTNHLIEEFMLLANRKVAEFIAKKSEDEANVFVYRIHDLPDQDKMGELKLFLKKLGFETHLNKDGVIPSQELNNILEKLEGKEEKNTVHTAVIRSMAKAIYSTKNIGHYGLAFEYYTHFTSPIRRYPDTLVHRLLAIYLSGEKVPEALWHNYDHMCDHSSKREKEASDAERASIKYKQVEYMTYRVGQTFDGVVTGISRNGIFVEDKESKCEGMIRLKDLGTDFYNYDEKENCIIGTRTKKIFKIGDNLPIKVASANLEKKIIDYIPG